MKSGLPKKPSTFDKYVAERSAHIEKLVEQAVKFLDANHYGNITDYCKALAPMIGELRAARASDPKSLFFGKPVRGFSYVTLLRNPSYRTLVERVYAHGRQRNVDSLLPVVTEDQTLIIASLHSQVNLLKDRLSAIQTGENSNALTDAQAREDIKKLRDYLETTHRILSLLMEHFVGIYKIVHRPEGKYTEPGLWSTRGLVAPSDELAKIYEVENFLKKLSKRMTVIE